MCEWNATILEHGVLHRYEVQEALLALSDHVFLEAIEGFTTGVVLWVEKLAGWMPRDCFLGVWALLEGLSVCDLTETFVMDTQAFE